MIKRSEIYLSLLLGLALTSATLYFALPRSLATYAALDGTVIANRLAAGEKLSTEDIRKLVVSRDKALSWGSDPIYARQLVLAYAELVERVSPENRKSLMQATFDATLRELRTRPLNGLAWWRLGKLDYNLAGGPTVKAAAFHSRSVHVAPNFMSMMPVRLKSIILNWYRFEPDALREVMYQFGATWRRDRPSILKIADTPAHRAIIRGAMAADPELLGAFEARLIMEKARVKR